LNKLHSAPKTPRIW